MYFDAHLKLKLYEQAHQYICQHSLLYEYRGDILIPGPDINRYPLSLSHQLHRNLDDAFSNSGFSQRVRMRYLFTGLLSERLDVGLNCR